MIEVFSTEFISELRNGKVIGIGVPLPATLLADLEDYAERELSFTYLIYFSVLYFCVLPSAKPLAGRLNF
jgi:hypothetical protein